MTELVGNWGPGFGLGTFALLVLVAVVRGDFIPRRSHEARVADLKEALAQSEKRSEDWRAAWVTTAEAQRIIADALAAATEYAKTSGAVTSALSRVVHPEAGDA